MRIPSPFDVTVPSPLPVLRVAACVAGAVAVFPLILVALAAAVYWRATVAFAGLAGMGLAHLGRRAAALAPAGFQRLVRR